ncbi:hypothetical protein, partial [Acetomicrobium sp. S15 = DSM 107314]|uniref:hypothetical protein n=1 Tax=Acetomicrobium sp. S15 = DSM 107314 TaxID=2529858 RepID=UPI001E494D18
MEKPKVQSERCIGFTGQLEKLDRDDLRYIWFFRRPYRGSDQMRRRIVWLLYLNIFRRSAKSLIGSCRIRNRK